MLGRFFMKKYADNYKILFMWTFVFVGIEYTQLHHIANKWAMVVYFVYHSMI